jgi:hypothetical protein
VLDGARSRIHVVFHPVEPAGIHRERRGAQRGLDEGRDRRRNTVGPGVNLTKVAFSSR